VVFRAIKLPYVEGCSPIRANLVVQSTIIRGKHAFSLFLIAHNTTITNFHVETEYEFQFLISNNSQRIARRFYILYAAMPSPVSVPASLQKQKGSAIHRAICGGGTLLY
jgi:hypothetical protein